MSASSASQMSAFLEHSTPAATVSNQFVSQFYTVLHTSPKNLHRFYSETSTLTLAGTRPQDGTHYTKTVTGQKSIHELVMQQGLEDTVTEVYSVDSQYSLGGGVAVQVTGTQSNKGGPKRPFVQTFFLAVQEKGFYVMNDMFRYLPDFRPLFGAENGFPAAGIMPQAPKANGIAPPPQAAVVSTSAPVQPTVPHPPILPPVHIQTPIPLQPSQLPPQVAAAGMIPPPMVPPPMPAAALQPHPAPKAAPPTSVSVPATAVPPPSAPPLPVPVPAEAHPHQQQVPSQQQQQQDKAAPEQPGPQQQQQAPKPQPSSAPAAPEPQKPAAAAEPKAEQGVALSYAERLKQGKASAPSSPTKQPVAAGGAAAPAPQAGPAAPAAAAAPIQQQQAPGAPPSAPNSHHSGLERSASQSGSETGGFPVEGPSGCSVFIQKIPPSVAIEELVTKLTAFGALRPNGVNLKTQRGKDNFAFVDFETPEAAQACMEQGLDFDGQHVRVVEKRPYLYTRGSMRGRGGAPTGFSGRGERGGYRGGRGGRGPYPGGPMPMDGGRGMGSRLGPMGGPGMMDGGRGMRGRGDGRRFDDQRGRGRAGPRPPMPVA